MKTSSVWMLLAFAFLSIPAFADPQYYEFSGVLSQANTQVGAPVDMGVSPGTAFSGVITYDPNALSCRSIAGGGPRIACASANQTSPAWSVSFGSFTLYAHGSMVIISPNEMIFEIGFPQLFPQEYDGVLPHAQGDTYLYFTAPVAPLSLTGPPANLDGFQTVGWTEDAFLKPLDPNVTTDGWYWFLGGTAEQVTHVSVSEPDFVILAIPAALGLWFARRKRLAN